MLFDHGSINDSLDTKHRCKQCIIIKNVVNKIEVAQEASENNDNIVNIRVNHTLIKIAMTII